MSNDYQGGLSNNHSNKKLIGMMGIYTSASIFGPLLLIGGSGYLLDTYLETKPIITIVAVFISFVVTNFLLFKKTMILMRRINEVTKEAQKNLAKEENK